MKQYPHFLYVKTVTDSERDSMTGNWSDSTESWVLHSICREEPNGKGTVIKSIDGNSIQIASTVYMPKGVEPVAANSEVMVTETESDDGVQRVSGKVLRFNAGQLNCRLWV